MLNSSRNKSTFLTSVEEMESSMLFRLRMPAEGEACDGEGLYFCQGATEPEDERREASLGEERRLGEDSPVADGGRLSILFFLHRNKNLICQMRQRNLGSVKFKYFKIKLVFGCYFSPGEIKKHGTA